jgi:hypothetical protein
MSGQDTAGREAGPLYHLVETIDGSVAGVARQRHLLRTPDNRNLVVAEGPEVAMAPLSRIVPRTLPAEIARGVLLGFQRFRTDPLALDTLAMGVIDLAAQVDRLRAREIALDARVAELEEARRLDFAADQRSARLARAVA